MRSNAKFAELNHLLSRLCDGEMDRPDWDRLETLLLDDPAAQDYYRRFVALDVDLAWRAAGRSADLQFEPTAHETENEGRGAEDEGRGMAGSPAIDLPVGAADELPSGQWPRTPNPEPPFPVLSTTHYPLPTSHFSVGSWAFSYMVSATILGVGILGAWAYKITHYQHIAEAPSRSTPSEAMPEMVFVGRITGMVDVKWSDDPRYLPPLSSRAYVPLGRKYILDSGLMEITYDSGAKVILEGPCTYEVESSAGGYLALGKLTARVVSGQWSVASAKPQAANQKSALRPPPSAFVVRTPTAVITDLGTEFGVEVGEVGMVEVYVFVGEVEMATSDARGGTSTTQCLRTGQAARFDGKKLTVARLPDAQERFVWALPRRLDGAGVRMIAYWRFESADNFNFSLNGSATRSSAVPVNPVPNPDPIDPDNGANTRSASFNGSQGLARPGDDDALDFSENDEFTIEGWIRPNVIAHMFVVDKRSGIDWNGYCVEVNSDGRLAFWGKSAGTQSFLVSGSTVLPLAGGANDGWTHFAAVHQLGKAKLYVNGVLDGQEDATTGGTLANDGVFHIGEAIVGLYPFNGLIDELRISGRALEPSKFLNYSSDSEKSSPVDREIVMPPSLGDGRTPGPAPKQQDK